MGERGYGPFAVFEIDFNQETAIMALDTNKHLGKGGSGFQGEGPGSAAHMIRELQSLKVEVLAGAAADTNIAVTGIAVDDTLLSVIEFVAGVPTDRTANASITSAGNIQVDVSTAGNSLQLMWFGKP